MSDAPKYSAIEIERRWLVDLPEVGDLLSATFREIEDLYIAGSRLRLRKVTDPNGGVILKFGKKYGKRSPASEPVTNLYLSEAEHRQLATLPGATTLKRRYTVAGGALDIYHQPRSGLAIFEVEFDDEASAQAYRPPHFVTREVTSETAFNGFSLAEGHAV
jgi:CYTH domain-containing protein